jgi:hypothetical protein
MDEPVKRCLVCEQDSVKAPLLAFAYNGEEHWICAQDLPILIHSPAKLADRLPGLEALPPAAGH